MNAPLPPAVRLGVTLDDKYTVKEGWIYLSGTQALARLPIQQRLRDLAAGKNTGGYISGYRGSPLGRYDMELWQIEKLLKEHHIHFRAGVNEDLAATALWGSQYVGTFPGAKVDGVFGIWYGKGPGVDRSGDVLRHANSSGTSPWGGVVALAGDDHGAKSSTVANFSDQIFIATGMPVLYPANTQELLDFGLHGIAMSRYSGCWVGMKVVTDVVEGGGTIYVGPDSPAIVLPEDKPAPELGPGGYNIRRNDMSLMQEDRLYNHKLYAALAYARANKLNRITHDSPKARIGLLSTGKSYQDTMQALAELGIGTARAQELGIRVGKIGMVWPLDPEFVREFAEGLDIVIVVEEKRALLENQLKSILFDARLAKVPQVIGKFAGANEWSPDRGPNVLPGVAELAPPIVAKVLVDCLLNLDPNCGLQPIALPAPKRPAPGSPMRLPSFCSGCPHNRSTKVPEGSRALAGIGCHSIAYLQNPAQTTCMSHMGGEGAMWLGQAPFTNEEHVFANMGDGTYFHSGFLAVRQAIAAHVPITYKLLFNGFVSMTGGQPIDGELSVVQMASELCAEGVKKLAIVTDEPEKFASAALPAGVVVHPRGEMEAVQRDFRQYRDVSVIIYDQPCATERRRLRKRGKWPDPDKRSFINAAVCEGCGDCSKVSNCMSIEPLETPLGRKRKINQSSCNKDFSCVEGFCPSFVTVQGGKLRKPVAAKASPTADSFPPIPEPTVKRPNDCYSVLITGIGGTGVVTIGQIVGMAAHIDGLCTSVLDVTGLAQKYGAVLSHVRFAPHADMLHATRIAAGEADAVVGCDLVVTAGDEALSKMKPGRTKAAVCTDLVPTTDFTRNPDWRMDVDALVGRLRQGCGDGFLGIDGLRIANALMGDSIAANMFMLGLAWQKGMIPLSLAALDRAIELNGVQVEFNRQCFLWGRRAAHDLEAVEKRVTPAKVVQFVAPQAETLQQLVSRRAGELAAYQDAAYSERYRRFVEKAAAAEKAAGQGEAFAKAVARYYFKLLAHKDEFEVARLYSAPEFLAQVEQNFEGDYSLHFHVGAWPFGKRDGSGKPVKREIGPWAMKAFRMMAKLRGLRGSVLDPFRNSEERKLAAKLLAEYEADIGALIGRLGPKTHEAAVKIAALPEKVRGFGHVRQTHAEAAAKERAELWAALQAAEAEKAA
ncbi:indolepyruvate ferredoxin oxidoreductase family protein [Herbaspirillum sp. HC18]|nr:indolepyruvate ferredoxin oxidoreductase family protein [Herbaspirillum sp. HC18]